MDIRFASRCLLFNKSHYNHNVQDYVQAWYLYIAWHLSNVQHTKKQGHVISGNAHGITMLINESSKRGILSAV